MGQDAITLKLEPRKITGKAVKHLRKDGLVPAVIHDHGKPSVHVQGATLNMLKVWREAGKHHAIQLATDKQNYTVLIKDASFDPKKHQLTHIVFNAVDKDQQVEADIPIKPRYDEENDSSPAERQGLIVLAQLESVQVKAVPTKLPDVLEYNAEKLVEIGDHVSVADLVIPEGVELITEPEHTIATVYEPSALAAANDAAGGTAEPGDEASVESETETPEGEGGETEGAAEGENDKAAKPAEAKSEAAEEEKK